MNVSEVSKKLTETALGVAYHGTALREALHLPCLEPFERYCIGRWLDGSNVATDHVALQDIAVRILADA